MTCLRFLDQVEVDGDANDGYPQHVSFEVSFHDDFLPALPCLEVVLYDLEDGAGAAQISLAVWMEEGSGAAGGIRRSGQGQLRVAVREARQLPRMDSLGLSDPYAVVRFKHSVDGAAHTTKTRMCTLEPVWNEEFVLQVPEDAEKVETFLEVQVWDFDVDADDLIGVAVLDVTPLLAPRPATAPGRIEGWVPLRTAQGAFIWGSRVVGDSSDAGGSRWLKKFRRFEVESVLSRELSLSRCLGSARFSRSDLERARQDHVRSLPKMQMLETARHTAKMSQMLGKAVSPASQQWLRLMTAFTAWKSRAAEQQDLILLDRNNSTERFASSVLKYHGVTQEGRIRGAKGLSDREVELQFCGEDLPRYKMFGLIDTFIIVKCKSAHKNQFHELARSRVVFQELNPVWEPMRVSLRDLEGSKVRIEVWRLTSKGGAGGLVDGKVVGDNGSEPVGFAETTFELVPGLCRGLITYEKEYEIELVRRKRDKKQHGGIYPSLVQLFNRDSKAKDARVEWKLQMQKKKRMYGLRLQKYLKPNERKQARESRQPDPADAFEEDSLEWRQHYLGTIYCKKADERLVGFSRTVYTLDLEVHSWNQWTQIGSPSNANFKEASGDQTAFIQEGPGRSSKERDAVLISRTQEDTSSQP